MFSGTNPIRILNTLIHVLSAIYLFRKNYIIYTFYLIKAKKQNIRKTLKNLRKKNFKK
jgi:hypothetical protein